MKMIATAALAAALALPVAADDRLGWDFGGGGVYGITTGDFSRNVSGMGGIVGHTTFGAPSGLGLRIDGSFQFYGSQTLHVPIGNPDLRQAVDVTTDNWVARLSAGPQISFGDGRVRPYLYPFAGVSYFSTTSDVYSGNRPFPVSTSTNFDDAVFSYGGGAGLAIALGAGSVALDLGATYTRSGRVSYLTEGDFTSDGHGGVALAPHSTETAVVEIRLGVAFLRGMGRPH
jgi:hypothetical protein